MTATWNGGSRVIQRTRETAKRLETLAARMQPDGQESSGLVELIPALDRICNAAM